jgi:hypothetical protein
VGGDGLDCGCATETSFGFELEADGMRRMEIIPLVIVRAIIARLMIDRIVGAFWAVVDFLNDPTFFTLGGLKIGF